MKQRELVLAAVVSLGKTNSCINALYEIGIVKAQNFKNSKRKLAHAYMLSPVGNAEKKQFLPNSFLVAR